MSLGDYLSEAAIVADIPATGKDGVLETLVDALLAASGSSCPGLGLADRGSVLEVLRERERLGSTGVGDGVGIPHGKVLNCERVVMAVGRSLAGCDFDAVDGGKCHVFCLILAPEGPASGHFSLLVRLARILKSVEFRKRFMEAEDASAIWRLINQAWHS